jgi:hypothetical protein
LLYCDQAKEPLEFGVFFIRQLGKVQLGRFWFGLVNRGFLNLSQLIESFHQAIGEAVELDILENVVFVHEVEQLIAKPFKLVGHWLPIFGAHENFPVVLQSEPSGRAGNTSGHSIGRDRGSTST